MFLYHGTDATKLDSILSKGLMPRGKDSAGNWTEIPSHGDYVYLSTFGAYFAAMFDQWLVLEIDLSRLEGAKLFPDEDVIGEASVKFRPLPKSWIEGQKAWKKAYLERLAIARSEMEDLHTDASGKSIDWKYSLEYLGVCCHKGPIAEDAITRYVIYSPRSNIKLTEEISEIQCSHIGYQEYGHRYRGLNNWLFGYQVSPIQVAFDLDEIEELKRSGINEETVLAMSAKELGNKNMQGARLKWIQDAMSNRKGIQVIVR